MNSLLNPSRQGALSLGRFFTTASISALVKGSSNHARSTLFFRKEFRLNVIASKLDCPSLSLKASQGTAAFV
jgi:hypothetical protein